MNGWNYQKAKVGDCLPVLTLEPISRTTLALYAGASGDHNPVHIDIDAAKQAGYNDVFAHGMLVMAYLGRAITDAVPQSDLHEYGVKFTTITHLYERLFCCARVEQVHFLDKEDVLFLYLEVHNSRGEIRLKGDAKIVRRYVSTND